MFLLRETRRLPADLAGVSSWSSPAESTILDRAGIERARFRLVEPSSWPAGEHDELVEAFLAAAPRTFYEPRRSAATSVGAALRRVLAGEGPPASPLSTELARLLLAQEPPGAMRRLREDLVSTWLDATVPLSRRVVSWLDRVPLCLGRRGLEHAARVCLGNPLGELGTGARVGLAVAAAWQLDLAGDRDEIEVRRAEVFDALVVQKRLDGLDAAALVARGLAVPRPSGPEAWTELVALEPRHRFGRSNEERPVTVHTELEWELQRPLADQLGAGSFVVLEPAAGIVRAMGGDLLGPVGTTNGPTPLDLAAWAAGVVRSAGVGGRLPDAVEPAPLVWTRELRVGDGPPEDPSASHRRLRTPGVHPRLASAPQDILGATSLTEFPLAGTLRRVTLDGATLLLHEELVVVHAGPGDLAPLVPLLSDEAGGAAFSRPERFSWSVE